MTSKEPQSSPRHFPNFDIIGMFITIFTKTCLWPTSGACWIQPTPSCTTWLLLLRLCQCPFDSNRFLTLIFSVTEVLSPPGLKEDLGIRIIVSGLELCGERMRNEETNMMVRRTFDTSGLNIVICYYSGMLAVIWDVTPRFMGEI